MLFLRWVEYPHMMVCVHRTDDNGYHCSKYAGGKKVMGVTRQFKTIEELLKECENPPITKLIAKKDIALSNSPIEAINKICKRFLRYYKPKTYEELQKVTADFVRIYNTIRPHGSLDGLTPFQSYQNIEKVNYSPQISSARTPRFQENKSMICGLC
jgi:hypothetical protein